jgi:PAS domain S-box-containing protein
MKKQLNQMAARLSESEARFALLAENSTDMISRHKLDGMYIYASPACRKLLGYAPEELVGRWAYEFFHPDDLQQIQLSHTTILQVPEISTVSYRIRHKAGYYIWFETTSHTIKDPETGELLEIQATSRDITQRKETELRLQQNENLLDSIIQTATDAIISINSQQHILIFNPAAEKMFGYTAQQMLGQPLHILLPPAARNIHDSHILKFSETGMNYRFMNHQVKILAWRANGEEFPIEANISQATLNNERIFTVIVRDVSERVRMEEALRKSDEQLRQAQKMEAIGRLAGGIAHDFNNLLTAILGYSDLTLLNIEQPHLLNSSLLEIRKCAERATLLTRQLLTFSRPQPVEKEFLDLNQSVSELAELLKRVIGEDIQLIANLDPKLMLVQASVGQLEQVLMNLAVNARDAMPTGGKLLIETKNIEVQEDKIWQYPQLKPGVYAQLSISDTGCGIEKQALQHIFEPFFTTKEVGKGTGLGLSIVYSIVKQSNGHVLVYSEPGIGTTFTIYLPRFLSAPAKVVNPVAFVDANKYHELTVTGIAPTIMVVEDDASVREVIKRVLTRSGYQVITTQSGQEALQHAHDKAQTIDLVLTDQILPDMSGDDIVAGLLSQRPNVNIIRMSGYSEGMLNEQSQSAKKQAFLPKPFNINMLLDKVQSFLPYPNDANKNPA